VTRITESNHRRQGTFAGASAFNQLLASWNTSGVTTMQVRERPPRSSGVGRASAARSHGLLSLDPPLM